MIKEEFDYDQAIKDEGVCLFQKVKCKDCIVGKMLGYDPIIDEYCDHKQVLAIAKVVREI